MKIVTELETDNCAVSYEGSVEGHERAGGAESLPSAQEAATEKMFLCNFVLKVLQKASF